MYVSLLDKDVITLLLKIPYGPLATYNLFFPFSLLKVSSKMYYFKGGPSFELNGFRHLSGFNSIIMIIP